MTAARKLRVDIDETDPSTWASSLQDAMSETVIEAMTLGSSAGGAETVRKWLAHAHLPDDADRLEVLFAAASALALELSIYTPSLSGVRPVDRLARQSGKMTGDRALAPELLRKAKFTLFRIEAPEGDATHRAQDLATGASFLLFGERFPLDAFHLDLGARICAIGEGLHVLVGPIIPLGPAGFADVKDFIRPGKGLINDQRCAALVYRDYVRGGADEGLSFGLEPPDEPIALSLPDEELDGFALDWLEMDEGPTPTGEALAEARSLASGARICAALSSCIELRGADWNKLADVYQSLAAIQMETMHRRGRIGSGETRPLETLRALLVEQTAKRRFASEALALFDDLARPLLGEAANRPDRDTDVNRVVERIRALRAKTTAQGCTEQEALLAAEKVAEMLERYGLSLSEIEFRKQACEGFNLDTGRRKREPSDRCVPAVAEFCDCRVWSETSPAGFIRYVFFGLPADVEAAHYLYDLVVVAFGTETAAFKQGDLLGAVATAERRGAVASFQIGLATGICDKLAKLKEDRQAAMFRSSGRDLVPVKASILDEEIGKLGLSFHTRRIARRRKVVAAAYEEGHIAGGNFEVRAGIA